MLNVQVKNKIFLFSGVLLFLLGILFLTSNYWNEKVDNAYAYMNNILLETNEVYEIEEEVDNLEEASTSLSNTETPETKVETVPKKEYVDPYQKYYIGSLEIPKIGLNKGFTDVNSKYNTVNKNIQVINGSTYPNYPNGNLIIAAHSGTSYLAYFKNLYKLNLGDIAYVNYQNKKYTYKIVNIYEQDKTGKIAIRRNPSKTCLTLVTCTKNSKTKQTVYIFELQSVEGI